jgi:hypothetical protein
MVDSILAGSTVECNVRIICTYLAKIPIPLQTSSIPSDTQKAKGSPCFVAALVGCGIEFLMPAAVLPVISQE